ncbi:hypothetical protein SAMN05428962_0849 [Paenibacillus sp. BC26]|nr:hypothetical protein SAMN05428962_0849 [Paenibacillus sp. BC26]
MMRRLTCNELPWGLLFRKTSLLSAKELLWEQLFVLIRQLTSIVLPWGLHICKTSLLFA